MKLKKKTVRAKVVKPNSVNYTFIADVVQHTKSKEHENKKDKKTNDFDRKTLKDSKTTKTHYKFNSRSPKSQQGHSPVYE
ncbi:MAG: hypothetical protein ACREBJ_00655 [Nitrosotalea sp.]